MCTEKSTNEAIQSLDDLMLEYNIIKCTTELDKLVSDQDVLSNKGIKSNNDIKKCTEYLNSLMSRLKDFLKNTTQNNKNNLPILDKGKKTFVLEKMIKEL